MAGKAKSVGSRALNAAQKVYSVAEKGMEIAGKVQEGVEQVKGEWKIGWFGWGYEGK